MAAAFQMAIGSPFPFELTGAIAFSNYALDADTKQVAMVTQMPEAATITHACFRYGARTGTPPVYRISIQSLGTDGNPSGTILGGGSPASATFTPPADTTWNATWREIALDNSIALSRGQLVAVVLDHSSGTIDVSNNSSFSWSGSGWYGSRPGFPFATIDTGASWVKQTSNLPVVGLKSASSFYGFAPIAEYSTALATLGHRVAVRFNLSSSYGDTFKVVGLGFGGISPSSGQAWTIGLWNAAGTALQSLSIDSDANSVPANTYRYFRYYFDEATLETLSFGTTYYLGIEREGSNCTLYGVSVNSATELKGFDGGDSFYLGTWDGSSWTDDQTVRPLVELLIDDITEPAGGGGGGIIRPLPFNGGLV